MKVGELEVTPISDGFFKMPQQYFPNADWEPHKDLLGPDGTLEIPIGCFVVRSGDTTVLIDAGLGPVSTPQFGGGDLPSGLEAAGVSPSDVDLVVLTHLHVDHIGWTVQDGKPFFPNATVRFGSQDLDQFIRRDDPDGFAAPVVAVLEEAGRMDLIFNDGEIAPGISTLHTPGHTLGHRCVVLSSGEQRAYLLGDAITCPIQLEETDWEAISDIDPKMAKRSRETLWKELEGTPDVALAAHFPGLAFNRVLAGQGKRYWA